MLLTGEADLDETRVNRELDKLLAAWKVVAEEAEWLLEAFRQQTHTDPPGEESLLLQKKLVMIVTFRPAMTTALRGARDTSDRREYVAHMQTYIGFAEQLKQSVSGD
jgi:hypothetical protein